MLRTLKFFLWMIASLACTHGTLAQDNPFANLSCDSVVIYDFDWRGKGEHFSIIDKNGRLAPTVKKRVKLDGKTAKKLGRLMGETASYGQATAACFEPHLGVVYYKSGAPVAHINICISCNRLYSSLEIPAQKQGRQGEGNEVYYTADGMSKSFRKYLNGLLKDNNFSHQGGDSSLFD
jgi:hypothetical protein